MPAKKEYTAEFKEQAVRFVLEVFGPDESRKQALRDEVWGGVRLGPG
jgi:hypothetical protein